MRAWTLLMVKICKTPKNTPKHIINKTTIWNQRTDANNMHLWTFVLVLEMRKVNWRVISRTITPSFSHIYISIYIYISYKGLKYLWKKLNRKLFKLVNTLFGVDDWWDSNIGRVTIGCFWIRSKKGYDWWDSNIRRATIGWIQNSIVRT
jgi:hypothetical protein